MALHYTGDRLHYGPPNLQRGSPAPLSDFIPFSWHWISLGVQWNGPLSAYHLLFWDSWVSLKSGGKLPVVFYHQAASHWGFRVFCLSRYQAVMLFGFLLMDNESKQAWVRARMEDAVTNSCRVNECSFDVQIPDDNHPTSPKLG